MPHENYGPSESLVGQRMQERMDELGLSIRDLADKTGTTYEYSRRMVRGLSLPSKLMIRALAEALQLDRKELENLTAADKIAKEHGDVPFELSGKDPEVEPFQRNFKLLTDQQKEILLGQLRTFVGQNRKHRVQVG